MGSTLNSVSIEYYVSTSATSMQGGSWSTTTPQWQEGKYIWQRINYGKVNGTTTYSTPVCIQGAKGEDGTGVNILDKYPSLEELKKLIQQEMPVIVILLMVLYILGQQVRMTG